MTELVERGDVVRLKEPYELEELHPEPKRKKFTHGVVAEIVSTYPPDVVIDDGMVAVSYGGEDSEIPRNVSLFLFNLNEGEMYVKKMAGSKVPVFVDFHVSELVLVQKHDEKYNPREQDLAGLPGVSNW